MFGRMVYGVLLLVAVVSVLPAAACRSGGEPKPTPTATATTSPEATASPETSPSATSASTTTPTASATEPPAATPTPTPRSAFYTVVAGDTLFSIARRFGTTVEAIQELNGLSGTTITVGQVLRIPAGSPVTPTPAPSGASTRIDHGARSSNLVALTFDMGGRVDPAVDIVNWLIANQVPATIFMTGAMAENPNTDAGRQVLALIEAHPDLFQLGNHSYSHPDFRELTAAQIASELARGEAAIARYTSVSPRPLFRPPYGAVDSDVLSAVGAAGYPYSIMWDVDTADWQPPEEGGPTAAGIVAKVAGSVQGGSIVIMHLGGYNTLEALPGILAAVRERGLTPAKVSALLP